MEKFFLYEPFSTFKLMFPCFCAREEKLRRFISFLFFVRGFRCVAWEFFATFSSSKQKKMCEGNYCVREIKM
jgi:hypothetical protein